MTLRRSIRVLADRAADALGVLAWRERTYPSALTILTYHRVLPDGECARAPLPGLAMPASAFEAQVRWFASRFECLTLSRALMAWRASTRPARPLLAITFDDGYLDNAEVAAPILERAGVSATFFLVSSFVGTDTELWFDTAARWHRGASAVDVNAVLARCKVVGSMQSSAKPPLRALLDALKRLPDTQLRAIVGGLRLGPAAPARGTLDFAMTDDDARRLAAQGHELACHTATHPILTHVAEDALDAEIDGARRDLEQRLGPPIVGFCYPNGDHDDRIVSACARSGYAYACTTAFGRNPRDADPMRLRRINMNPEHVTHPPGTHSPSLLRAHLALLHTPR